MSLTGAQYIGQNQSSKGRETFSAIDPKTGSNLPVLFHEATIEEIDRAIVLASNAFTDYSQKSNLQKATFLECIADEIMALDEELVDRAMSETALPKGRIVGERGRTVNQLRLFADVLKEGSWVDARIDTADQGRTPAAKPDIRQMLIPLGPVTIFGASNFPLAFSVAGGDTASALASGCTVVVKGHPAHPGTSELIAQAILHAVRKCNMPDGVFSMVQGISHRVGTELVQHPLIKAVGFTGSFKGGKALFDIANRRTEPIPVYAEMGSTNPVFILPGALRAQAENIANGLAHSVTLGVGQFCTNPGLVVLSPSDNSENFKEALVDSIQSSIAGTMLTKGIKTAYEEGLIRLEENGIAKLVSGKKGKDENSVNAQVFETSSDNFVQNTQLSEEVFGPSTIIINSTSLASTLEIARSLEGHLTATIHGTDDDLAQYVELIQILKTKVGRILLNGYPTGVEVCHAMVHGGPYPATTNARSTSVGTNAIKRFLRPICYQNFPDQLLPEELKNSNPNSIWRLINGSFSNKPVS